MTSPTYGDLGSLSTGTMRPEDLVSVFSAELRGFTAWADKTQQERGLLIRADAWECSEDPDPLVGGEILGDLFEALEPYAPPYAYFGSHEGDGADYGYWLSDFEDIRQEVLDSDGLVVSDLSEVPDTHQGEVLHVNDHGNATLYVQRVTVELEEVWGVV